LFALGGTVEPLGVSDPRQVGAYRLLGRLGAGGMGQVFLGESPGGRKVAVKLVLPQHAADAEFRQRFAREVAAARQVGGFHTAHVVDADPDADPPWMVTAYIPGPSLDAAVKQNGPLETEAVRRLGAALTEGLAAVHACGLVHRDLKPNNIILAEDGPRIIDFGIARPANATALTSSGVLIGTLSFMSPEQVHGEHVDSRSDIFALGGVLAYAATGRGPFDAATIPAIVHRIASQPPDLRGIGDPLREIISACLAKRPADRPPLNDLMAFLSGTAWPRVVTIGQPAALSPAEPAPGPGPGTATASLPGRPPRPLAPIQRPGAQPERPARSRRTRMPLITAASLVGLTAVGLIINLVVTGSGSDKPNSTDTTSSHPVTSTAVTDGGNAAVGQAGATKTCVYTAAGQAARPVSLPSSKTNPSAVYTAVLRTNRGDIAVKLLNSQAPCTVNSFAHLAKAGFWDNSQCHRLSTSGDLYMLQCGDPTATASATLNCSSDLVGTGGPGYEFASENLAKATYPAGTVAMANSGTPDSNGSQFFLVYKDTTLPPDYTPFGTVTSGLGILQDVASAGTSCTFAGAGGGVPREKVIIDSVTITKS
jgi:serine/threonine protein kinase/cyclophilin family peptidyl-prolyl cis-trans isomerase